MARVIRDELAPVVERYTCQRDRQRALIGRLGSGQL
jgi:hypothetical protein